MGRKKRGLTERQWLTCDDPAVMLAFLRGKVRDRKLRLFAAACCRIVWGLLTEPVSRRAVQTAERAADGEANPAEQVEAFQLADRVAQGLQEVFICGGVDVPGSNFAAMSAAAAIAPALSFEYTDGGEEARRRYEPWECAALAQGQCAREHSDCGGFPLGEEDERQPSDGWYARREEAAVAAWHVAFSAARKEQCHLLRDVFANPFRPPTPRSASLTPTVTALAHAAYEERALPAEDVEVPRRLTIAQIGQEAWRPTLPAGHLQLPHLAVLADALEEAGCTDAILLEHLRGPGPHVRGCWAVDALLGKSESG